MKVWVDNLDGTGARDYSATVDRGTPVVIERRLNAPAKASGGLVLEHAGLSVPVRGGRLLLTDDGGDVLFTGYLEAEPEAVYAGAASAGTVYRYRLKALSDEWLLDRKGGAAASTLGDGAGAVLAGLANAVAPGVLGTGGVSAGRIAGVFRTGGGQAWSVEAGALADATLSGYRVLGGVLTLNSLPGAVRTLSTADGSLEEPGLVEAHARDVVNDVTLTGEMEPGAYWTELFLGDGTTVAFDLTGEPAALTAGRAVLAAEDFSGEQLDRTRWAVSDPGGHVGLGGGGLTLTGGNGLDGQTTIALTEALELGGTLVCTLDEVMLTAGSAGVLGGLYSGSVQQANCVAGWNVRQAGGQTVVTPLLNGVEAGQSQTFAQGHRYTVRMRVHCAELLRVKQSYYALVQGAVEAFGGGLVTAALQVTFEVRDLGVSSNTPVTVLYDGMVANTPAKAVYVAANSVQLLGAVGRVRVVRTGTAQVTVVDAQTGTPRTAASGGTAQGLDCQLGAGRVTFYAGRVPGAGDTVRVSYRGRRRAVGRVADAGSIATESGRGGDGHARLLAKVVSPVARSREDCESAARALLAVATDRDAALEGTYTVVPAAAGVGGWDPQPGDLLTLTANGRSVQVLLRTVRVEDHGSAPEALRYKLGFANGWARELGVKTSAAVAADAVVPVVARDVAEWVNGTGTADLLANLQQMTVIAATNQSLTIDAGTAAPAGGGFEVRRRDGGFGAAAGPDLVLQSPVRGFQIPRLAMEERFFIRMYDGASPANYSRVSFAVATHLPVG